jgi:hypothetical protein
MGTLLLSPHASQTKKSSRQCAKDGSSSEVPSPPSGEPAGCWRTRGHASCRSLLYRYSIHALPPPSPLEPRASHGRRPQALRSGSGVPGVQVGAGAGAARSEAPSNRVKSKRARRGQPLPRRPDCGLKTEVWSHWSSQREVLHVQRITSSAAKHEAHSTQRPRSSGPAVLPRTASRQGGADDLLSSRLTLGDDRRQPLFCFAGICAAGAKYCPA